MRHFLDIRDFNADTLSVILDQAASLKADRKAGSAVAKPLAGKSVAMIFEKPSTRTRVSFEVGITELGGTPLILSANDLQVGRGESVSDTAKV
ncbi:MAG: ornithine carbamoyltransferase, partial [Candidatus Puniceispirillum sp.]|nr:ornithine carbamoyltransferase [Candidatus Puniceispirillum sp.]